MTDWHTIRTDSDMFIASRGAPAPAHPAVTGEGVAVLQDDQTVVPDARILLADRLAAAAAASQTGILPEHEPGAGRPAAPRPGGPLAAYRATRTRLAGEAQALARLVADTLTTVLPDAAYLVLRWDPGFTRYDLDRVLNRRGAAVHVFTGAARADRLPALPDRHPLRTAWEGADPADPRVLEDAIRMLDADGGHFDLVPYRLPHPGAPAEEPCLLLAPGLRAALPEAPVVFPRLVRPYA